MTDDPPTRVLLAASFPPDYIQDTIVPSLASLGIQVVKVVPVDYKGEIRDVEAVLFMFQYTSHVNHDKFKERTKAAGIKFILLERQSSGWPRAFKTAGLDYPGYPIKPAPLPVAGVPPKAPLLIVGNGKPLIPPPPKEPVPEPVAFHVALRREREAQKTSRAIVADLCNVSVPLVEVWEKGGPIGEDCYQMLLQLFSKLKDLPAPQFARPRARRQPIATATLVVNGHNGNALPAGVTTFPQRPDVEIRDRTTNGAAPEAPPAPLTKANGHSHRPPLEGLLRAARALGIKGPLTVTVDDGGTTVQVGEECWAGTYDGAVETARAALDARLGEMLRALTEARSALGAS